MAFSAIISHPTERHESLQGLANFDGDGQDRSESVPRKIKWKNKDLVPKRGLEPPHPDGYYTLNVARLPIPPLRHWERTLGNAVEAANPGLYVAISAKAVSRIRWASLWSRLLASVPA